MAGGCGAGVWITGRGAGIGGTLGRLFSVGCEAEAANEAGRWRGGAVGAVSIEAMEKRFLSPLKRPFLDEAEPEPPDEAEACDGAALRVEGDLPRFSV